MRLQVEIKDSLYEQCKLVAQTRGINLSALVREALEDAIDPDKAMAARLWKENDERLGDGLSLLPERREIVMTEAVASTLLDIEGGAVTMKPSAVKPDLAAQPRLPVGVVVGKDFVPVPKPTRKPRGK